MIVRNTEHLLGLLNHSYEFNSTTTKVCSMTISFHIDKPDLDQRVSGQRVNITSPTATCIRIRPSDKR